MSVKEIETTGIIFRPKISAMIAVFGRGYGNIYLWKQLRLIIYKMLNNDNSEGL